MKKEERKEWVFTLLSTAWVILLRNKNTELEINVILFTNSAISGSFNCRRTAEVKCYSEHYRKSVSIITAKRIINPDDNFKMNSYALID